MILFDTDILTLFLTGHETLRRRVEQADEEFAITVITRIEVLLGRFASVTKAADGIQLQQAMARLQQSDRQLAELDIVPIDLAAATEFDRLRQNKKIKKIGRCDLLIAGIALANKALLVSPVLSARF
jgi:predicted nucleic acid-binding protein